MRVRYQFTRHQPRALCFCHSERGFRVEEPPRAIVLVNTLAAFDSSRSLTQVELAATLILMRAEFGHLLRNLRRKSGKTMHQIADHLGVSIVFISDVERGNRHPFTPDRVIKTAQFLKINPEPLLLAAAKVRGAFELDATGVSGKARQVGAALMRGWADLDENDLDKIAQIMRRREEE